MAQSPNPADYMTDAQYEQFRRDGGVSGVSIDVDILNVSYSPDSELLVEHFSGFASDLSDEMDDACRSTWGDDAADELDDLDAGDWLVAVDGEVVEAGEFCPFRTHVRTY